MPAYNSASIFDPPPGPPLFFVFFCHFLAFLRRIWSETRFAKNATKPHFFWGGSAFCLKIVKKWPFTGKIAFLALFDPKHWSRCTPPNQEMVFSKTKSAIFGVFWGFWGGGGGGGGRGVPGGKIWQKKGGFLEGLKSQNLEKVCECGFGWLCVTMW